MEIENLESAINDLDYAIVLDPLYAESFWCRGIAYTKLSEFEKAYSDALQDIKLNPNAMDDDNFKTFITQVPSAIQTP